MNSNNKSQGGFSEKLKTNVKFFIFEVIGVALFITGVILICTRFETTGYEVVNDYTDCPNYDDKSIKCKDTLINEVHTCYCYVPINITKDMDGQVTAFYELESYDQSNRSYVNSRDDKQLSGELSLNVSKSCDPYTYAETPEGQKPIAPCGEIADTMFNDTLEIHKNRTYVPYFVTGLISEADKAPYRNPPGNLTLAFTNFTKPKNWIHNVWELDKNNPENNGFQNEAFIAWMKTDWKRKPLWRVNHTGIFEHGLPSGKYILRVKYAYPPSRYDGRRKFIISSVHTIVNPVKRDFGIALMVIGIFVVIGKTIYNRIVYGKYLPCRSS